MLENLQSTVRGTVYYTLLQGQSLTFRLEKELRVLRNSCEGWYIISIEVFLTDLVIVNLQNFLKAR